MLFLSLYVVVVQGEVCLHVPHDIVLDCVFPFIRSSCFKRGTVKNVGCFSVMVCPVYKETSNSNTKHCLPYSPLFLICTSTHAPKPS